MFLGEINDFNIYDPNVKARGIKVSETQAKAIFTLLDFDESGELEPFEITGVLQDRMMLGRNKEMEVRDEAIIKAKEMWKKFTRTVK